MKVEPQIEQAVIEAVEMYVDSIVSGKNLVADISSLSDATSALPLKSIDEWERLIRNVFYESLNNKRPIWHAWKTPRILSWVDVISWDGRIRERALRAINGAAPNCFFLIFAIRRLNDWVPEVRAAAREKMLAIAEASKPEDVANAIFFTLRHLNSWGRMEREDKDLLLKIVSNSKVIKVLKKKIITDKIGPISTVFSQIGRVDCLDDQLLDIAKGAAQPAVRARAYRSIFEGSMSWLEGRRFEWTDKRYGLGRIKAVRSEREIACSYDISEILKHACEDHSPMVKRIAIEIIIRDMEKVGDWAIEKVKIFAGDKSKSVQEIANFALSKYEKVRK